MQRNIWIFIAGATTLLATANAASVPYTNEVNFDYTCGQGQYTTYDPTSCSMYIKCSNGKMERIACPWFHRFNEKTNTCSLHLWIFGNADCSKVSHPVVPNPTTAKPNGGGSTGSTTPSSNGGGSTGKPHKKNAAPVTSFSITLGLFFVTALIFCS